MAISAFGRDVDIAAFEHAVRESPNESVGCVLTGGRYVPLVNVSDSPHDSFRADSVPDEAIGIIHSHPTGDPAPSAADMSQQQATGIPWGIVSVESGVVEWFGDSLEPEPYLGRQFLSGVRDCWCLIRDWYRKEHGIILDNLPRDSDWYKSGTVDLLNPSTIKKAGFYRLDSYKDLRIGDIAMGSVGSRVVNHCCIYLTRGLVLHHVGSKVSGIEPLNPWIDRCRYFVRHVDSDKWVDSAKQWLERGGLV